MSRHWLLWMTLVLALGGCERCAKRDADGPRTTSQPTVAENKRPPIPAPERPALKLPPIPDQPLSADETASCDAIADLEKQLTCLMSLAQRNRDPRYCGRVDELGKSAPAELPDLVRSGALANGCLRTIAFMRDDPSLCTQISLASAGASCLSYFAMKRRDPKVCELATNEAQHMCYQNEAARTRDAKLCEKTGASRDDCVRRLGPLSD